MDNQLKKCYYDGGFMPLNFASVGFLKRRVRTEEERRFEFVSKAVEKGLLSFVEGRSLLRSYYKYRE